MRLKSLFYSLLFVVVVLGASVSDSFTKSPPLTPGEQITQSYLDDLNLSNKDIYRVGAKCCDGTNSKATGRGACSHHGGVKYWKMSDGTTVSTGRCD